MKQRNPTWGCPRIAQQIALAFDIPIDQDVVRRILAGHYRPEKDSGGPSWLTFIGHIKDSLWSLDLFRCESASLRPLSHPFVERLIGTIRREYLDRTLFWTKADLENKLLDFQTYFNKHRAPTGLQGRTPDQNPPLPRPVASLHSYGWQRHCRGLYHTPWAA